MPHQRLDVLDSLVEAQDGDRQNVEMVEQLETESPPVNFAVQIARCRADQTDVGRPRIARPNRNDSLLLQRHQQLSLSSEVQICDFVQIERAAVGYTKATKRRTRNQSRCALHLTKQLRCA